MVLANAPVAALASADVLLHHVLHTPKLKPSATTGAANLHVRKHQPVRLPVRAERKISTASLSVSRGSKTHALAHRKGKSSVRNVVAARANGGGSEEYGGEEGGTEGEELSKFEYVTTQLKGGSSWVVATSTVIALVIFSLLSFVRYLKKKANIRLVLAWGTWDC